MRNDKIEMISNNLAVVGPPGALPRGPLGPLGASWGAWGRPIIHFDQFLANVYWFWNHFETILDVPDPILNAQTSILEPQVPRFHSSFLVSQNFEHVGQHFNQLLDVWLTLCQDPAVCAQRFNYTKSRNRK